MSESPQRAPMSTTTMVAILIGIVAVAAIGLGVARQLILGAQSPPSSAEPSVSPSASAAAAPDPVARTPLDCEGQCFTAASVGGAIPSDADFLALGLDFEVYEWGNYAAIDVALEHKLASIEWPGLDMESDTCFFTHFATPVAIALDGDPGDHGAEMIEYTSDRMDSTFTTQSWHSARVFGDSQGAEEHMRSLADQIAGCPGYPGADGVPREVTPSDALSVPDSVGSVGWTETTADRRYQVFDLQRGNLVVRSILTTPVDGITEDDYRAFVEQLADDLAAIEPVTP